MPAIYTPTLLRTPLHVAVAYRNLEMLKFLVHQGASLFVATHDGDTPLKILVEDHKMISKEEKDSEKTSQLEACLQYLTGGMSICQWTV